MNGSLIFWIVVIIVLVILWGIHIRRCCKYLDTIKERRLQEQQRQRRVLQTITINVGRPPYTIEDDVEENIQSASNRKIDKDLPTYEEVMEEDMRRTVNQTNVNSNPPPRY